MYVSVVLRFDGMDERPTALRARARSAQSALILFIPLKLYSLGNPMFPNFYYHFLLCMQCIRNL